jgi:hypothetical protein
MDVGYSCWAYMNKFAINIHVDCGVSTSLHSSRIEAQKLHASFFEKPCFEFSSAVSE